MYKVLLVDPDTQSRERTIRMLNWEQFGFTLESTADTSSCAMFLFNKPHSFSLVLINMKESQLDQIHLCEHIRKKSTVPIILIGGATDFQLARKAMNVQVFDYLPDPINPSEFISSLLAVRQELDSTHHHLKPMPHSKDRIIIHADTFSSVIERIKEYAEKELHRNITLKNIATKFHFNCAYLGQKFKYHEKMTFNEYLLRLRMERAKSLLKNTEMKIYEIANVVGYTEMDWFYKKFKDYTGVSANEYRKRLIGFPQLQPNKRLKTGG